MLARLATRLAALGLVALGLGMAPAAQAAWMWTGWEDTPATQDDCLQQAASALRSMNFTVTVNPQTTFGWRGQDGVSVRCIAERRVAVIFVYAATASEEGRVILEQVRHAFKAAVAPPPPGRSGGGGKF